MLSHHRLLGVCVLGLLAACGGSSSEEESTSPSGSAGGDSAGSAGSAGSTSAGAGGATAGAGGSAAGNGGTAAGSAGATAGSGGTSAGSGGAAAGAGGAKAGSGGSTAGSGGAAAGAGGSTAGSGGAAAGAGGAASSGVQTVFLIVMENHNWIQIKGSSKAPYINNTLLPMSASTTAYKNPPAIHPSLPNYLWLEAGTNFFIFNDSDPSTNHQSTKAHLSRLLEDAGVTWKSYQEDIPGTACPLKSVKDYAPKHNPFVYFDDVTSKNTATDPYCIAHNRPYAELDADLKSGKVARYNFITPNLCNDMHDSCAPINDSIKQGDTWLSNEIPKIMASDAYKNNGAIFVTWDEGSGGDGPIGMMVVSPLAKPGGYTNKIPYTHSSTLRTMQDIFGVKPYLGDAANATNLSDLFTKLN